MSSTLCHYHPDKVAVTVCERCRRPICLTDKRIYEEKKSSWLYTYYGFFKSRYSYKTYDYCPVCYALKLNNISKSTDYSIIWIPIIAFVFLFILIAVKDPFSQSLLGIVIIFVVGTILSLGIIASIFNARVDAKTASHEAIDFLIQTNQNIQSGPHTQINTRTLTEHIIKSTKASWLDGKFNLNCYECGEHLKLEDKYCPICGDSTHDELVDFYNIAKKENLSTD